MHISHINSTYHLRFISFDPLDDVLISIRFFLKEKLQILVSILSTAFMRHASNIDIHQIINWLHMPLI